MDGAHLHKLLDIESNALFKGRITYVSVMILTKGKNASVKYNLIRGDVADVQSYFENLPEPELIPIEYFSSSVWAPELRAVFDIKNKYARRYGTLGANGNIKIGVGIQALWKKLYDIIDFTEKVGIITGKIDWEKR